MGLFSRRRRDSSLLGVWFTAGGDLPPGYRSLLDCPEVSACVDRISGIVSTCTIYQMRSSAKGDIRVKDALSRFVDIDPWPGMSSGPLWKSWIVGTLLSTGDGNAFALPRRAGGRFIALEPMPGASASEDREHGSYRITWQGRTYAPDEVLHFRLHADPARPWLGRGYKIPVGRLADSLLNTEQLKAALSSPRYKPPLIVSVNSDADLAGEENREKVRQQYLEDTDAGKPWILPADLIKVEQIKPLTLSDLAVKDTVELDKKAVAAIFGVPAFLLGLGQFSQKEYNNFVHTVIEPICKTIETELTLKLLSSEDRYFTFNRRRLYSYDLESIIKIDTMLSDRGFMNGDEVREDAMRDPAGLTEFKVLENYIPWEASGAQNKLTDKEEPDA